MKPTTINPNNTQRRHGLRFSCSNSASYKELSFSLEDSFCALSLARVLRATYNIRTTATGIPASNSTSVKTGFV
jgi:hypothetical protein